MAMLFNFQILGKVLRNQKKGLRQNPPQAPKEYLQVLDDISKWARAGLKKPAKFVSGNAKMNKVVLPKGPLGTNAKLQKAQNKVKWVTQGVALMPANELQKFFYKLVNGRAVLDKEKLNKFSITEKDISRFTHACPGATRGCMSVCLADSGQMHMAPATMAQVRRHLTYEMDREAFMITLAVGLAKAYHAARKKGANYGVRLNVTSDLAWEKVPVKVDKWLSAYLFEYGIANHNGNPMKPGRYRNIMELMPQIYFYDYTKVGGRFAYFLNGKLNGKKWPKNYHLVWSLAETPTNRELALIALLHKKTSVSVPFDMTRKRPLPKTLTIVDNTKKGNPEFTFKVIDADMHDMRMLDRPGTIAGLRFKIPMKKGRTTQQKMEGAHGFVVKTGGDPHPVIYVNRKRGLR